MIKPNWNAFKAKFCENPQYHFEWFCYLLFCREQNKPYGVFRYKNQSAIEVEPVVTDNGVIGFQSKFYETALSNHRIELRETLNKTKRDYPTLTKLYLYTNQEWSQAFTPQKSNEIKATKTSAQLDIEDLACKLGIELEWRTLSYFESLFVCSDCSDISKFFFIENDSLFNVLQNQTRHTEAVLNNIKNTISFSGQSFSIDRENILDTLTKDNSTISIICGKGGVGKTVEIKNLYNKVKDSYPIFAFKATEFEINKLDDLLHNSGAEDFFKSFNNSESKFIIIDSAEKLMELKNQEPFKEFIDLCIRLKWRVIFTTRDYYFDDLNFMCINLSGIIPRKLYINVLSEDELITLSKKYLFELPGDSRLLELIKTPFYLNEFLKFYDVNSNTISNLSSFKNYLWNQKIKKGDSKREHGFMCMALKRANEGRFYIDVNESLLDIAKVLKDDEVLNSDGTSFFISHDIYEEWALEKFIDATFKNKLSTDDFFSKIGQSLPVRRCFRLWLSERIFINDESTMFFIENTLEDSNLDAIWKDEFYVAILLSNYSKSFFINFESYLLNNDFVALKRVSFLLQIACKEIDNSKLEMFGFTDNSMFYFTKPKGSGWESFINFIYDKVEMIGILNIKSFIPTFNQWNNSFKKGEATKKASSLCLNYYRFLLNEGEYLHDGKFSSNLLTAISYGASEIRDDLTLFIDDICSKKISDKKMRPNGFVKMLLSEFEGVHIANALPRKTLELAQCFWLTNETVKNSYNMHVKSEDIYGVTDEYEFNYNPESALQTPMLSLLSSDLKNTLDFIIEFTNRVTSNLIKYYGKDNFIVSQLVVNNIIVDVYLDANLWGAYRGAGNAPDLLKSILMSLEKFFLNAIPSTEPKHLEYWLSYILSKTNSSAICGVVASIILKDKDRLFNVARIIFGIKEFIQFDNSRFIFDRQHKSQLQMLGNMFGGLHHGKIYHDERLSACDDEHRKSSLESVFLYYQLFRREGVVSENEVKIRQDELWGLLDFWHGESIINDSSEKSKLWRMCLARMDSRRMDINTELIGNNFALSFNPRLDSDLKEMSEESKKKQDADYKYLSLNLWASNKLRGNEDYKKYPQYELSIQQAGLELKELMNQLSNNTNPTSESFLIFNRTTHINVSAVLIKYHLNEIDDDILSLCTKIVTGHLINVFSDTYRFQIGDGVDASFDAIPALFKSKPDLKPDLIKILLLGLLKQDSIDTWGNSEFNTLAIQAIMQLWDDFEKDVESIFKAYVLLNPVYVSLINEIRQNNLINNNYSDKSEFLWEKVSKDNETLFMQVAENNVRDLVMDDYDRIGLHAKSVAVYILPNNKGLWSKQAFMQLTNSSLEKIFNEKRDRSSENRNNKKFLKKCAYFILQSPLKELPEILNPFHDNFNLSEGSSDFLEEIVYAQDRVAAYDNFWFTWGFFKNKIIVLSKEHPVNYRLEAIIKSYLLSLCWKSDAKSWHALKDNNHIFFRDIVDKLTHTPSTLYCFSKLLNGIGNNYSIHGLLWLVVILRSKKVVESHDINDDTIFYLNSYIKNCLYHNRTKVRTSPELMSAALTILDFLIDKGEVSAYLLRESIV